MALKKCRECGREVSRQAKTCQSCGINYPGLNKIEVVSGVVLPFLLLAVSIAWFAGGDSKTAQESARASSIKDVKASTEAPAPAPKDGAYSPQHIKVQDIFRSKKEPTAKDALWTAPEIFKVGVIDDGTLRDGYAQYVCGVLYSEGFKGKHVYVQIIDIVKLQGNGVWRKIGEAQCL